MLYSNPNHKSREVCDFTYVTSCWHFVKSAIMILPGPVSELSTSCKWYYNRDLFRLELNNIVLFETLYCNSPGPGCRCLNNAWLITQIGHVISRWYGTEAVPLSDQYIIRASWKHHFGVYIYCNMVLEVKEAELSCDWYSSYIDKPVDFWITNVPFSTTSIVICVYHSTNNQICYPDA